MWTSYYPQVRRDEGKQVMKTEEGSRRSAEAVAGGRKIQALSRLDLAGRELRE